MARQANDQRAPQRRAYQAPEFKVDALTLITLGGSVGGFDPAGTLPALPPEPGTDWGDLEDNESDWY